MRALWMTALIALAAACAPVQRDIVRAAPATAGSLESGRHIAELKCAGCHAIGTTGDSHNPAAPPFRTFSHHYPVTALEEAFAEGILVGHPAMPEFSFTPEQIDDLLSYLESVQERRGG
jgi:cytochrome c